MIKYTLSNNSGVMIIRLWYCLNVLDKYLLMCPPVTVSHKL